LVVRWLARFIALAKFVTGGQGISPKTHQHFIPGLVRRKQVLIKKIKKRNKKKGINNIASA
jgi:hypothetical protein